MNCQWDHTASDDLFKVPKKSSLLDFELHFKRFQKPQNKVAYIIYKVIFSIRWFWWKILPKYVISLKQFIGY